MGYRLLYWSFYSSPRNLRTCSTWAWAKIFFSQLLEHRDDVFLYMLFPDTNTETWEPWMDHPRCEVIRIPMLDDQFEQNVRLDQIMIDRFREFEGPTPVDIVIVDKLIPVPQFKAMGEIPVFPSRRIYALNVHYDFTESQTKCSDTVLALQGIAARDADLLIHHDEGSLKRLMDTTRRQIGPAGAAKLLDNAYIGRRPFDEELAESIYQPKKPNPPPYVINWGTSFNSTYKVNEVIGAIKKVIGTGIDARLLITSSSASPGAHSQLLEGCSFLMSQNWRLPRHEFYERLNQSHITVFWAWRTGFSGSQLEQAVFKVLGIYHQQYPMEWLPPDYPFLFEGEADLPEVIIEAVRRYKEPKIQAMLEDIRQHVLKEYGGRSDALKLRNKLFELCDKKKDLAVWSAKTLPWLPRMLDEVVPPYDEVTFTQMRHRVKDVGTKGIWPGAREGYKGTWIGCDDLRDAMICCGWEDDCSTSEPVFRFKPWTRIAPPTKAFEERVKLYVSRGGNPNGPR